MRIMIALLISWSGYGACPLEVGGVKKMAKGRRLLYWSDQLDESYQNLSSAVKGKTLMDQGIFQN
jgi:hypothetical protein